MTGTYELPPIGAQCQCGAGTIGDCVANTCEKVQAAAGVVAWMHEFNDPHTGQRSREPRLNRPKDYELQPGDTVRALVYAAGTPWPGDCAAAIRAG
jgi:hypothetical protein